MKVATLSGISDVKCRMSLEPGNRVHIAMSGFPGQTPFVLQSVARDKNDMVYVFNTDPSRFKTSSTLILKMGTGDPAMLIGGTVESVRVTKILMKGAECTPDGNGKLSFEGTKRQTVDRPVVVGDVFKSERREYHVEYIAQDGSLVCRMYSRKSTEDSKYMGLTVIDGRDAILLDSLDVKIKFAYS
ncbi:hypothetical protein NCT2020_1960 [Enterobacter phage vB_EkoM5VN]|uniref:Uncharacterized protein n=1 Tax=Enterobacter phage vB_EkoM5VN TaxID=2771379 RepID=A0A7I8HNU5_9CAUD|nr:hypothetical protein NCT2020_1960 [Enterobacter phage vB_EkoM5VN]